MNAITINYASLDFETLIKIFELADLLQCTPKEAAKTWLLYSARTQLDGEEVAA